MGRFGPDAQTKALLDEVGSFVVLALFPDGVVRVVAAPRSEDVTHEVARAIADQGYLVWFANLWTDEAEGQCRIERYERPSER